MDYDYFRLEVLSKQGFHVYLNGHLISSYVWWSDPEYRIYGLDAQTPKCLKKGTNVLAVYANAGYEDGVQIGQFDIQLKGLRKADLLQDTQP